jgi:tetratricopeptide (TPR) repeat protein
MRGQLRTLLNNLSAFLMRDGRFAEAALVAQRTANLAADAGDPSLRGAALSLRAEALLATGELDLALASVAEAELLQRERDDRVRALTLLRRADILEAMGQHEDALAEARAAQEAAQQHEERGFFVTAVLWETLHLARRGAASTDEVREALAATRAAGVGQRPLTRRLIEEAAAWVDKATAQVHR